MIDGCEMIKKKTYLIQGKIKLKECLSHNQWLPREIGKYKENVNRLENHQLPLDFLKIPKTDQESIYKIIPMTFLRE